MENGRLLPLHVPKMGVGLVERLAIRHGAGYLCKLRWDVSLLPKVRGRLKSLLENAWVVTVVSELKVTRTDKKIFFKTCF